MNVSEGKVIHSDEEPQSIKRDWITLALAGVGAVANVAIALILVYINFIL